MAPSRNRRGGVRRRNFRNRRNPGRGRNSNLFNRKVQRVGNRPYLKPRKAGYGNIASNATRRLMAYPSSGIEPDPKKPAPTSSWWLDSLSWLSSVALRLLGILVASSDENEKKFVVTGAGTRIDIDSGFIFHSSPLAVLNGTKVTVPFEQYRILWLRFIVTPIVDVAQRGGSYVCAIVPVDGIGTLDNIDITYDMVIRQPGSVVRPIDKPCSVSWSPSILEYGLRWHNIADVGDPPVCAFVISFSDLALNKPDNPGINANEYSPKKAGFEIIAESRVETRRAGVTTRDVKLSYLDPTVISVSGLNYCGEVLFSSVNWSDGFGSYLSKDVISVAGSVSDFE